MELRCAALSNTSVLDIPKTVSRSGGWIALVALAKQVLDKPPEARTRWPWWWERLRNQPALRRTRRVGEEIETETNVWNGLEAFRGCQKLIF